MSQAGILNDMVLNTPSIGSLLSQTNGTGGAPAMAADGFSSLLSNQSTAAPPASGVTATPAPVSTDSSSRDASSTSANQTATSSVDSATSAPSGSALLADLKKLAAQLHKTMQALQQQKKAATQANSAAAATQTKTGNTAQDVAQKTAQGATAAKTSAVSSQTTPQAQSGKNATVADTQKTTATQIVSAPTTTSTIDAAATDNTNVSDMSASTDASAIQTLESLIAQLMLLTQAVIKNLEQNQNISGGTAAIASAASATDASPATPAAQIEAGLSSLQDLMAALDAKTGGKNLLSGATSAAKAVPATQLSGQVSAQISGANTQTAATQDATTQDLTSLETALRNITSASGSSGQTTANASDATQSSSQPASLPQMVEQLLTVLEKTTQQIAALESGTAQTNAASATQQNAAASVLTAISASAADNTNLMSQLAAIETKIKDIFSVAQKQTMDGTAAHIAATSTDRNASAAPMGLSARLTTNSTTSSARTDLTATSLSAQNGAAAGAVKAAQNQTASPSDLPIAAAVLSSGGGSLGAETQSESSLRGDNAAAGRFDAMAGLSGGNAAVTGGANFADHLASLRVAQATGIIQQPSAVDQAILQISRGVKNGNDEMSVQLHPADMGKITVKLDFSGDGKVQGTVTADNPKTLDMLQKDSRSLERALQDAGLRADPGSLSFNLGNQSGRNSGQNAAANASATPDGMIAASDSLDEETGLPIDLASIETYYVTPNGVNIRV